MNRSGEFVFVKPIKHAILLNTGELLEKWSGGIIKATVMMYSKMFTPFSFFSDTELERRPIQRVERKLVIQSHILFTLCMRL